jgi:hypothetical protein
MHARYFVACVTLSGGAFRDQPGQSASHLAAVVRSVVGRWLKQVDGTVAVDGRWQLLPVVMSLPQTVDSSLCARYALAVLSAGLVGPL